LDGDAAAFRTTDGEVGTKFLSVYYFNVFDPTLQATITFGTGGTLPSSPVFGDVIISQLNGNLNK